MNIKMGLEGFEEFEETLDQLSNAAGKGVLRRSLKVAAEPMAGLMRDGAPEDEGDLRDSIAVSPKLSPRQRAAHRKMFRNDQASVEMFVGPGPLPQAHLSEFGTFQQSPQPYVRPAWDQDHMALLDRIGKELWPQIRKTLARAERRAARLAAKG